MLTMPTKFSQHHMRGGANNHFIVKIVSGSSTWLFSDVDMQLTDGAVYGLLLNGLTISQSMDYRKCLVNISEINLQFSNVIYNPYGAVPRLSELWASIGNDVVDIYLAAGPITAIADCLKIFSGRISGLPSFGETTINISIENIELRLLNIVLPNTTLDDAFNSLVSTSTYLNQSLFVPILYGDFNFLGDTGNKRFKGSPAPTVYAGLANTNDAQDIKIYVFSDHDLFSVANIWPSFETINNGLICEIDPEGYHIHEISAIIDELDNPPQVKIEAVHTQFLTNPAVYAGAWAYIFPNRILPTNGLHYGENVFIDDDSYVGVYAFNTGVYIDLGFDSDVGSADIPVYDVGISARMTRSVEGQTTLSVITGINDPPDEARAKVVYPDYPSPALGSGPDTYSDICALITGDGHELKWKKADWPNSYIEWNLFSGSPDQGNSVEIKMWNTPGYAILYALRLIIGFDFTTEMLDKVYVECSGRKFGSWIDNANHSNSFDAGDLIKHPPYIIESILIDVLGVAEANIDQVSFDRAYDSNVEARIALHTDERRTVREIFAEFALQSLFAVQYSSDRWSLIPLYGASTASSAIISWGNIDPDSFIISRGMVSDVINSVVYKYCYRYDLDDAIWSGYAYDSTSLTKYGEVKNEVTFRYIVEDSAEYVANFLFGTNGYWSTPIKEISFYSPGFTYSQLDLGDIIDFDAGFDNHVLDGATSFSGEHFMIVGKQQSLEGLTLTVIPARMRA